MCSRIKNSDRVCVPAIKELLRPAVDEFSLPSSAIDGEADGRLFGGKSIIKNLSLRR